MGTWEMTAAERASLADALDRLPDSDWTQPSLCDGWTVRDVVGHMVTTAQMTPPKFLGRMAANGFRFHAMNASNIQRTTEGRSNAELVAALRERINTHNAPPGPSQTWLGETIVHGEDIFRSLGAYREHPIEHVVTVADFYSKSNLLIGSKRRIEGITLSATDADWRYGNGPEARGPAIALVMAMTGRKRALEDLTGEGVGLLRRRD